MGIDVYFHRVRTLGELKDDENLVITPKTESGEILPYIAYGDSQLTLYSTEDDDYLTIARYCGSDFTVLLAYLWKTYGIMAFDDTHFDEQIFYRVMGNEKLTKEEKTAWADYYFAGYMLTNVLSDDEKLKKCVDDNEETRLIVEEKMFYEHSFAYKFDVLFEKHTTFNFRLLMQTMAEELKMDYEIFLSKLNDIIDWRIKILKQIKEENEKMRLNGDELPF